MRSSLTLSIVFTTCTIFCMHEEARSEKVAFYNDAGREVIIAITATILTPEGAIGEAITTARTTVLPQHFLFINRPISKACTHSSTIHASTADNSLLTNHPEDATVLAWDFPETCYGIQINNGIIALVLPTLNFKSQTINSKQ
jgi:hypothetical protein